MLNLFNNLNSIKDIEDFIQATAAVPEKQARENSNIEYKEADQKFTNTNEIGKDVSAFANSEGGLIFYGVKCDPSDKTKPQTIIGLEPKNIETFDRVVNSHIHYPIKGIKKKLIPDHNPQVMLVYVPQSDESPHQSGDNKYYIRLGSESKPMPHYLVELHFGKRRSPKLSIWLGPITMPPYENFQNGFSPPVSFNVFIGNSGKRIARDTLAILTFPAETFFKEIVSLWGSFKDIMEVSGEKRSWQWNDREVIHPGINKLIWKFTAKISENYLPSKKKEDSVETFPYLEWDIFSDEMKPQKGQIIIHEFINRIS